MRTLKEFLKSANSVAPNKFDEKFERTDFRPKKKPTLKERINKSVTNLFSKLKKSKLVLTLKNWWLNNIKKPIKQKRAEKKHENYVKELKANFSEKFNVDVEKNLRLMKHPSYSPNEIDSDRLLIENGIDINKRKSRYKFAPFIYEPEIVDVHNENLKPGNPTINEIINSDVNKYMSELIKQEKFLKKRPHLTVVGRKNK